MAERPVASGIVAALALGTAAAYLLFNSQDESGIEVITTEEECDKAVTKLRKHCKDDAVLGFDCEFNNASQIDLIQLCSTKGYCALFRTCVIDMPDSLEALLEDTRIIKVGVGTADDSQKIQNCFDTAVEDTLDLRFPAVMTGYEGKGLASLYKQIFGKELKNDKSVGNWRASELNSKQINYAATDVKASIEIYTKLIGKFRGRKDLEQYYNIIFEPYHHRNIPRVDNCVMQ